MLVFLLLMNASGFAIMLLDKNLARRHCRRVPEALLLAFAACFGQSRCAGGDVCLPPQDEKAAVYHHGPAAASGAVRDIIFPVPLITGAACALLPLLSTM